MTKMTCAKCGASDARVTHVAARSVPLVLFLECQSCRHRWQIDGEIPYLRPKPDRRKEPRETISILGDRRGLDLTTAAHTLLKHAQGINE